MKRALSVILILTFMIGAVPAGNAEIVKEVDYSNVYYPYLGAVLALPYFIDHQVGAELAAKYYGAKTQTFGPTDYDMMALSSLIEQQTAMNPTALFISAFEDTLSPAIDAAVDKGIPVFTIDMDTLQSKRQVFLGGDHVEYGKLHARSIAEVLSGSGDIILIYKMGQNSQDQRARGFRDELAVNYPNVRIVAEVNSEVDSTKDADALKAALQANPSVTGISTLVDSGPLAAATAIREIGRTGEIQVIGDSKDDVTLDLIKTGEIYGTVAIKTISEPWYAAMLVDTMLKNNISITKDDKAAGVSVLPQFIDIGTFLVTKENVDYFYLRENPHDLSWFEVTPPQKDELYYCIGAVLELPYFMDHRAGFEAAVEELGVQGKFVGPLNYDMTAEAQLIEEAIAQNAAGILVMAFEDTLSPAINKAVEAGIPVVTIDMDTIDSKRDFFIGGDTVEYGRIHARSIAENMGGEGEVLLLYKMGQNSQDQRAVGFREEIALNYPGIKIVAEVNSETDSTKDADALKAALMAHPNVKGISTLVDSGPLAAATAVREFGKTGEIVIVGDSKDTSTLQLIKNGEITSTVAINTVAEPYLAMKILYLHNHTNFSITQDDEAAGINPLPSRINIGTFVIDASNVEYFLND